MAGSPLPQAAQAELLELCEVQFAHLEKLQNELLLSEPDLCDSPQEQIQNRLMVTEAELKKRQTEEPKLLAENPDVLFHAGKEEMLKLCSQLETVLSCCEAKRDKLRETKELEQKWLEEKVQVLKAVKTHVEQLQKEKENVSALSMLQDIKEKIQKMKAYQETLMECLGDILEKHIPLPQVEPEPSRRKKKSVECEITPEVVSLSEVLEALMNKALQSPHDPYVIVDNTFWPPYVEMLLRYGIAVRHQENNFKIRLGAFF
ncbi:centromere protein K isoform X2 [Oryzias melastigma]|uniref:centromere protein K isoform X2 n=1 Tax=Oryzias melastigma TaxID=30732 RepID=UPI000CF7E891|nr:centromere protein K isoform X2 [Oryzias melastigma]